MSKVVVHHHPDNKPSPQLDALVDAAVARFEAIPEDEKRWMAQRQKAALDRHAEKFNRKELEAVMGIFGSSSQDDLFNGREIASEMGVSATALDVIEAIETASERHGCGYDKIMVAWWDYGGGMVVLVTKSTKT